MAARVNLPVVGLLLVGWMAEIAAQPPVFSEELVSVQELVVIYGATERNHHAAAFVLKESPSEP